VFQVQKEKTDMGNSDKDYHCKDCEKFDETEIPVDCKAGHGKVAFRRGVCSDFVLKAKPMIINENK
jgi:hypothetical protein